MAIIINNQILSDQQVKIYNALQDSAAKIREATTDLNCAETYKELLAAMIFLHRANSEHITALKAAKKNKLFAKLPTAH